MTEYTPTTETVRYAYAAHNAHYGGEMGYQKQATEFDRWLAEHDRQVQAEALEQAADVCERIQNDEGFGGSGAGRIAAAKVVLRSMAEEARND